jgi:class 3 adenylate cyclase
MGKIFYYNWRWTLHSSPEEVWPLASDTHNFNQVTGLPRVKFEERPQPDGSVRRFASGRLYGFMPIQWEEFMFEWVKPLRFGVYRIYNPPFPLKSLRTLTHLHERPDQSTEIHYEVWAEARGLPGLFAVPFGVGLRSRRLFGKAFRQMDHYLQGMKAHPFETPIIVPTEAGKRRLEELLGDLRRSKPTMLVDKLAEHLQNSPVEALIRMRPYAFADQWGMSRSDVLALFLQAASIGLLDLSWDILCPECRGAKAKTYTLASLPETVHCPSCNIDYTSEFDQSVEATFSLNQQIAEVNRDDFCIGGPHTTPHVLMQQLLQPNETRTTTLPLKSGYYRLRAPRLGGEKIRVPAAILTPLPGQPWLTASQQYSTSQLAVQLTPDNLSISVERVADGKLEMTVENLTDHQQMLLLEDGTWSDQIATAADVTTLQAFRELFSTEALRPGYTVSIQSLVFLFTDIKGSTTLYQQIGDASAFGRVIDHFAILRDIISQRRGGVVKTIGDSVMAVFRDPGDAMHACLEILDQITLFNKRRQEAPLILKMGLHQGACIAVNLNERLDYFGSTVNIASRLEGQSKGGDIVTTHMLMDDPGVQDILLDFGVNIEQFTAELRGFGEHKLYRVCR